MTGEMGGMKRRRRRRRGGDGREGNEEGWVLRGNVRPTEIRGAEPQVLVDWTLRDPPA
jgi:hypothetical protein